MDEDIKAKKEDKRAIIILCSIIGIIILFVIVGAIITRNSPKSPYYILEREETSKKEEPKEEEPPIEEEPQEEPDIEKEPFPEVDLDIDKVIKDYNLEEIKQYIEKDKDYFKQYAYVIINNNYIQNKKPVLDMYKIVMLNTKYLDKESLLSSLKELMIIKVDKNVEAGTYDDSFTKINAPEGMDEDILYHEIIHFIEHRLPGKKVENYNVCVDGNKYTSKKENPDCKDYSQLPYSRFIIEVGTETNLYRYFKRTTVAYEQGDTIYNIIAYMIGEQKLNDIFFSNDTLFELLNEFHKYGITLNDYVLFLNDTTFYETESNFIGTNPPSEEEYLVRIINVLDKIYDNKYGHSWESDPKFSFLMRLLYNHTSFNFTTRSNFTGYIKQSTLSESEQQLIQQPLDLSTKVREYYNDYEVGNTYVFILNDNKVLIKGYVIKNNKSTKLEIEYDLDNDKIIKINEI